MALVVLCVNDREMWRTPSWAAISLARPVK
jgi:hypothetical protein